MEARRIEDADKTLLVFNCHEAWVYQLGYLGFSLDIIVGLEGRYSTSWDEQMRPVPKGSRLVTLDEALASQQRYYCIVTHNIKDLLDIKARPEPRILVLHMSLEGRSAEEQSKVEAEQMKDKLAEYVEIVGGHVVASSLFKGQSWGFTEDVVDFGVDVADYPPHTGQEARGLRIANFLKAKRKVLLWDFHEKAFAGVPVKLVGHNPDMEGVSAASSWDELKGIFQSHRFYIHTADPRYEAGFNMATVEAMAAEMPILGNVHPGSPVRHGISGFLSDDPSQLARYARVLLEDRDLANAMGHQ